MPRGLRAELNYVEPDYGYLVADTEEYVKQSIQVLEKKSRQTLVFAIMLEEYLLLERQLWPNVFARLTEVGVSLPEPSDLTRKVIRNIDAITQRVIPARAVAFDKHCSDDFLSEMRGSIKEVLAAVAAPHFAFLDEVYEKREGNR